MLAPYGDKARSNPLGIIDLSIGTPVDATPDFIQKALSDSANSPAYPATAGTAELQKSLKRYATEILGATGDFAVLPTIGSKELITLLPTLLESNKVLIPKIAYPSYQVSGLISKSEVVEVDIDSNTWPEADLAWVNTPSNPTGRVHSEAELHGNIAWARSGSKVLAVDECYVPFPDSKKPISIFSLTKGDNRNIIAAHSLSKRSNLAGYRAGFIFGDPRIINQLLEVRKHLGLMVPLPVQAAMVAALSDETHVHEQAARYVARRKVLVAALTAAGFTIDFSEAGLYIWCSRSESDWEMVAWFADRGILTTPGSFYGQAGKNCLRISLTATDKNINAAADRIRQG
ncbi:unannotated protein [freshwater metagenome]|uniref:Unannotated protein n=1 Tax=freshwater metagenome TaxID=449393 RepID=A0A6J6WLX5_9ZZZZ